MLNYLKAAFFFRWPIAGLGAVPLNLILLGCFAILGIGLPALWLVALGLEVLYLFLLATSGSFQHLVDRLEAVQRDQIRERTWQETAASLAPAPRARVGALEAKTRRVMSAYAESGATSFVAETSREALDKLLSSYTALLRTQQTLASLDDRRAVEAHLRDGIASLERALASGGLSNAARDAKTATLATLTKRLEHLKRREETLVEVDSYLDQIEAQVDLALETAVAGGGTEAISADIDVASFLLDDRPFVESSVAPPRAME